MNFANSGKARTGVFVPPRHEKRGLQRAAEVPNRNARSARYSSATVTASLHAKSFRRLVRKTQVFLAPRGDHYRTRLTHTLEVAQVARTLARALRLNEDLTEAIALSHDLGHTPFGHIGEATLDRLMPGGFRHYEQSLRVVEVLENDGRGLNLTWEVRDGIANHTGRRRTGNAGSLVRQAFRPHRLSEPRYRRRHPRRDHQPSDDLPLGIINVLGDTPGERINTMVTDLIEKRRENPARSRCLQRSPKSANPCAILCLTRVPQRLAQRKKTRCDFVLTTLFKYYCEHPGGNAGGIRPHHRATGERGVCDFLACMTDSYIHRYL